VPLIAVEDPLDDGAELAAELRRLESYDWLVVTSPAGAERVAAHLATNPQVRVAVVGSATAAVISRLGGRHADLVPETQRADSRAEALLAVLATSGIDRGPQRILLALADRASPLLAERLRRGGHEVRSCVAYRTVEVRPPSDAPPPAEAAVFASGSAVIGWSRAFGTVTPPIVVAIGPTTADVAHQKGLKVSGIAADHSLTGVVAELERQLVEWGFGKATG
jgi:uroporphyrinogen-III synthase